MARLNDPGQGALTEIGALRKRYAGLWRFYVFVPAKDHQSRFVGCGRVVRHTARICLRLMGSYLLTARSGKPVASMLK